MAVSALLNAAFQPPSVNFRLKKAARGFDHPPGVNRMESLTTERLIIRDFDPADWPDLYEYLSDPQVVKFEPYPVFTEKQCQSEARRRSHQACFRAVCLKSSQKLIGNIYFTQLEPDQFLTWELGYVFNTRYQRQGYAAESCQAVLNYAFNQLHSRRVIASCNILNSPSWRLLERLHFRREGHFLEKSWFKLDEQGNPLWQDVFSYAILSKEWFLLPAKTIPEK
jgi:[ribosomal protein S5]-alanine N-acetyltransferase